MTTMTEATDVAHLRQALAQPRGPLTRSVSDVRTTVARRLRLLAWQVFDMGTTFEPVDD